MSENGRRAVGALVGGALGVLGYWQLERHGYHLLAIVGVGLALGVAVAARHRVLAWGLVTTVLALALSIGAEAWFRPFRADRSFAYFVTHLADLPTKSQLSLVAVAIAGLYFGVGWRRPRTAQPAR